MIQNNLQQVIRSRLGLTESAGVDSILTFTVDEQHVIRLDFTGEQLLFLAVILPQLPENAAEKVKCLSRVATTRFNLVQICREQVYLDARKRLMLRRDVSQSDVTIPIFDQLLQDFLNALVHFKSVLTQP